MTSFNDSLVSVIRVEAINFKHNLEKQIFFKDL
jgi:hypothetical protein